MHDPHRPALLARNVGLTLAGTIAPALAAIVSIPLLASRLGSERLAVLTVAWAAIGYFSLLDLGIGRALTNRVAAGAASGDDERLASTAATAGAMLAGIGVAGGAVTALLSGWIARTALQVPPAMQLDVQAAILALAAAVPALTTSAGARALLEARQRFDLVNAVRIPLGVVMYAGPLAVALVTTSVAAAVSVLAAARILTAVVLVSMCGREMPALRRAARFSGALFRDLARTGGWMTLANVAGSMFLVLDRMIVGAAAGLAPLAFYAAPQELITKLSVVPGGIGTVMFPAFSAHAASDRAQLAATVARSLHWTASLLLPLCAATAVFAPELLGLWLGGTFAAAGSGVARWVSLGVLAYGFALTPFGVLQASGRSRPLALLQCLELPAYAVCMWWVASRYGVRGAAAVWAGRAAVDGALLFALSKRSCAADPRPWRIVRFVGMIAIAAWAIAWATDALWLRAGEFALLLAVFGTGCWRLADAGDRAWLRRRVSAAWRPRTWAGGR